MFEEKNIRNDYYELLKMNEECYHQNECFANLVILSVFPLIYSSLILHSNSDRKTAKYL